MVDRYRQIVRELARLSSCYVDAQRLWGDLDDDVRNTRYMTREALTSNFNKCYVRSIGKDLSWSALRGQRRKLICVQVFTRTAIALGSAMTFVAGGWWRGILAVLALSILTRPLIWMRARDDCRKARRILDGSEFTEPEVRTLRKLLKSNLHAVPASTLDDPRWRALLEEAISGELLSDDKAHEEVLDIALELAKEYYGSVEELVETSLQLVSMSDQDAGFR